MEALSEQVQEMSSTVGAAFAAFMALSHVATGGEPMGQREAADVWRDQKAIVRAVPEPAAEHPGNVFVVGEDVRVPVPAPLREKARRWRAVDDRGKTVNEGPVADAAAPVALGRLGVGWYRVEFSDADGGQVGWTTAAVLAKLAEPVPQDSPVCADSATAWFARRYRPNDAQHQEIFARLAALAGVNWIRDRMSWGELETAQGQFAAETIYDTAATLQAKHGLKVLQVFHGTPHWATDKALDGERPGKRFPRDLRVLYGFCKAMAERTKGRVLAWEPWNEANIDGFGGHTIDEMCTLQKAAWLGFKAGDPGVVVCWNCYAGSGEALHTQGVLENEAWPYFETYNVHSYSRPAQYLGQHRGALTAACGRPLWLTECGIHVPWKTPAPWGDLSPEDERRQAEFIAPSYASSLFAGVNRHFFFILGNYMENQVQFGLLRHDHTPRPGYVALAAVGRLLAATRCLGRVPLTEANVVAFRARPDDKERDVLVAWAEKEAEWSPPAGLKVEAAYDYFGRAVEIGPTLKLRPAAMFFVLPAGEIVARSAAVSRAVP